MPEARENAPAALLFDLAPVIAAVNLLGSFDKEELEALSQALDASGRPRFVALAGHLRKMPVFQIDA